ncbi:MAG: SPOR domain-containing protein [Desulfarculaceae bacterium]|nr:SPOR domain-containing protein [Desulfarculaceae bacterium]
MIRVLRHFSVRVWLSCLVGIPLSFSILRFLNTSSFRAPYPFAVALAILLALYFLIGAISHHAGKKMILDLISRAQSWERAGIFRKAEQYYLKAVRIYDSFLLSPLHLEKTLGKKLAGSVSGFILSSGIRNIPLEQCIPKYLRIDPTDEDIALFWLKRSASLSVSEPDAVDQELITRLAEHHNDNPKILPVLTDLFLRFQRTDFTARKIYKEALKHAGEKSTFKTRVNELLSETQDQSDTLSEVDIRIPEPAEETARFNTTAHKKRADREIRFSALAGRIFSAALTLGSLTAKILSQAYLAAAKAFGYFKASDTLIRYAKRFLLAASVTVVLLFAVNTVHHLFKTEVPEKTAEKIEKKRVPKPFTLQVAAYLDPRHAKNYVTKLQKEGLDVSYSKSEGGGKTWYLVRVSSFPDKKSAAAYGKSLKEKGVIDDFFVDNR